MNPDASDLMDLNWKEKRGVLNGDGPSAIEARPERKLSVGAGSLDG